MDDGARKRYRNCPVTHLRHQDVPRQSPQAGKGRCVVQLGDQRVQCTSGTGQPKEGEKTESKVQSAVEEDLELMCMEPGYKTLKMTVDTVEIQDIYTRKAVQAAKVEENETTCCLEILGKTLEAIFREL